MYIIYQQANTRHGSHIYNIQFAIYNFQFSNNRETALASKKMKNNFLLKFKFEYCLSKDERLRKFHVLVFRLCVMKLNVDLFSPKLKLF